MISGTVDGNRDVLSRKYSPRIRPRSTKVTAIFLKFLLDLWMSSCRRFHRYLNDCKKTDRITVNSWLDG